MFVPKLVLEYFGVNAELVRNLQSDLAVARAERDVYKTENIGLKVGADWLRVKCNDLELQNKALLQKAYNISVPVPEIVRQATITNELPNNFSPFEDMGDAMAAKLGLPIYGK